MQTTRHGVQHASVRHHVRRTMPACRTRSTPVLSPAGIRHCSPVWKLPAEQQARISRRCTEAPTELCLMRGTEPKSLACCLTPQVTSATDHPSAAHCAAMVDSKDQAASGSPAAPAPTASTSRRATAERSNGGSTAATAATDSATGFSADELTRLMQQPAKEQYVDVELDEGSLQSPGGQRPLPPLPAAHTSNTVSYAVTLAITTGYKPQACSSPDPRRAQMPAWYLVHACLHILPTQVAVNGNQKVHCMHKLRAVRLAMWCRVVVSALLQQGQPLQQLNQQLSQLGPDSKSPVPKHTRCQARCQMGTAAVTVTTVKKLTLTNWK